MLIGSLTPPLPSHQDGIRDNSVVTSLPVNDIQERLALLQCKGWTLAAIADEVGLTVNAVEKWKAGRRYPANPRALTAFLDALATRKRVPKKKRYRKQTR